MPINATIMIKMTEYDYSIYLPLVVAFLQNDFNTWQAQFLTTNNHKPTVRDLQVKLSEEGVSISINHCNSYYLFPTINMFESIF